MVVDACIRKSYGSIANNYKRRLWTLHLHSAKYEASHCSEYIYNVVSKTCACIYVYVILWKVLLEGLTDINTDTREQVFISIPNHLVGIKVGKEKRPYYTCTWWLNFCWYTFVS